ncbi:MAG: hypothetical protein ACD_9C00161G0001 [uncultured bacterium]|nr:MAG: hypothetical protein ACD_9C00161G0001 [uncultured bacterium]
MIEVLVIENKEGMRDFFLKTEGERMYREISGSFAVEKKYCVAFDFFQEIYPHCCVKIDPLPIPPGERTSITPENLADLEVVLGILLIASHAILVGKLHEHVFEPFP